MYGLDVFTRLAADQTTADRLGCLERPAPGRRESCSTPQRPVCRGQIIVDRRPVAPDASAEPGDR